MNANKLKSFTLEINGQYRAVYRKDEADNVINDLLSKLHQESHAYDILYYRYKRLEEAAKKLKEEKEQAEAARNVSQNNKQNYYTRIKKI